MALSATPAEDIAGHYYLSGITEAGSELLLTRDGDFQWMLAYGAMDRQAEGTWTVDGKTLILTSRAPSAASVTFKLGDHVAWDGEATRAYQDHIQTLAIAKSKRECPLASLYEDYSSVLIDTPESVVETGVDMGQASAIAEQVAATERARQFAQAALERLKAHPGWKDDTTLSGTTDKAVADYETAQARLMALRDQAGITPNQRRELDLPPECRVTDMEKEANAFRGVAVDVFDSDRGQQAGAIQIEARYDHGIPVTAYLENGVAFLPLAAGQRIVAFSLHVLGAPNDKDTILPVSLGEPSVQVINADLGGILPPAFPEMRLTINEDGSLSPQEMLSRGTYRRAVIVPPAVPSVPSDAATSAEPTGAAACDPHGWEQEIGRRIKSQVVYPVEAYSHGIEGTAVVRIDIDRSGHIMSTAIDQSSGSDVLDGAAMQAAQRIGVLEAPPCGATGAKARIPVAFKEVD